MASKIQHETDGIYYRAIFFNNEDYSSLTEIFEKNVKVKEISSENKNYRLQYFTLNYNSNNIPLYLNKLFEKQKITRNSNGSLPINLLGIEITEKKKYFFVASPITDLLTDITKVFNNNYFLVNLNKLLNRNLLDIDRKNLRISRLSAKITDETSQCAQTLTLFGEDITKSNILKYIMEGRLWDKQKLNTTMSPVDMLGIEGGPFLSNDINYKSKLEPNSCKITLLEDVDKKFNLNIDKYGNFSFYIKEELALKSLLKIISQLLELELFTKSTYVSPLSRADESLSVIENG
jgi:hypothetical protein